MRTSSLLNCSLCGSTDDGDSHSLRCGNIDNSKLYHEVKLSICHCCGHVYNRLSKADLAGLRDYYNIEYAPINLSAEQSEGDRPGSPSRLTAGRYNQLHAVLAPHIQTDSAILDVGCAMGGFLDYLHTRGFRNLSGVDMVGLYLERARASKRYHIAEGNADSLPFDANQFDVVVMEQVLEHVINPREVFREAHRVLKDGGLFCIGVPNAARYADYYFFDYYWVLLREHIQHFDIHHLNHLAVSEGFRLLQHKETEHAVMSDMMVMPNLYAIFRREDQVASPLVKDPAIRELGNRIALYLSQEGTRLASRQRMFEALRLSGRPVYVWGIGREFLYLYEMAGLKHCRIAGLIDGNPFKRSHCSVGSRPISDSGLLRNNRDADPVLIITAIAHSKPITEIARRIGFRGEIITFASNGFHSE